MVAEGRERYHGSRGSAGSRGIMVAEGALVAEVSW